MEKLSQIISKKVVSLKEACMVGYILNAVFDENYHFIIGYIISDEESEIEKFLSIEDIEIVSEEGVFVSSVFVMQNLIIENDNNPIGKIVYDKKGFCLGRVEECFLENNKLIKLQTNLCEILQKNIFSIGKDFVIFNKNNKNSKKTIKKYKNKLNYKNIEQKAEILNKINLSKNQSEIDNVLPVKMIANKSLLIGKTLQNDVFGFNNEIIAKKDEKITEKIIKKAINHNKLNFLFFSSK